jgi:hypothetical protein
MAVVMVREQAAQEMKVLQGVALLIFAFHLIAWRIV